MLCTRFHSLYLIIQKTIAEKINRFVKSKLSNEVSLFGMMKPAKAEFVEQQKQLCKHVWQLHVSSKNVCLR